MTTPFFAFTIRIMRAFYLSTAPKRFPKGHPHDGMAFPQSDTPAAGPRTYLAAKRLLDVVGALCGLVLFAPLMVGVACVISFRMGKPLFHRRRVLEKQALRPGKNNPRTFDAFKFRTMIANADAVLQADTPLRTRYEKEWKLTEDPRVTPLGHTLRKWSMDEMPQLINVLRGQMSLVGPRMISPPELVMYGADAAALLSVKPGLTGLWQINGRTDVSYAERVRMDKWYIENRSFWLDVKILLKTVRTVASRKGAI